MKPLIYISVVFLFLTSCQENDKPDNSNFNPEDLEEAIMSFGYTQFKTLCGQDSSNVIVSPLSITSALYMASQGAEGSTNSEMESVLGIADMSEGVPLMYAEVNEKLTSSVAEVNLSNANKVFYDDGRLVLNDEFNQTMNEHFKASPQSLDFSRNESVNTINDWVSDRTEGRIPKVLENINSEEIMFLINAIHFIGDWEKGFPTELTKERSFFVSEDETVSVPTMFQDAMYTFVKTDEYSAVTLPFKGGEYDMTFILPEEVNVADFILSHTDETFTNLLTEISENSKEERLILQMPKIELNARYNLVPSLQMLGMKEAFNSGAADFSNFGEASGNLYLTRVLHDVFLKIDENGVEGAAATTVGVGVTSVPPSIILNRPYLFILKHIETGVPIFLGEIRDPSAM